MRLAAAALVIIASIAGGAIAQDSEPARPRVRWDEAPSGLDYTRFYPRAAWEQNISGVAMLCCTANSDRRLDCTAPLDWPQGLGFGEASLRIARKFRMSEQSYAELLSTGDMSVRRVIRWNILGAETPAYEEAAQLIERAVCPAPPAGEASL